MLTTRQKRPDRVICKWKCIYCGKCFDTKDALGAHLSGEFDDLTTAVDWVVYQMEELNVTP